MLVSSKSFPDKTKSSTMHTLVLSYGPRHVLVLLPKTYQELLTITCEVFGAAPGSTFVFETSDLDICRDIAVEIHPEAWEAIAMSLSTVVVKNKEPASRGEARGNDEISQHPYLRGKTSITHKRAHKAASGSSNEVAQSEDGLGAAASSYDDIGDTLPTDDVAEDELASYDDEFEVAITPRRGKGRSHVRIESDDEAEAGDGEGHVEAFPVVKLPASYRSRSTVEPSFSIVPSPPKRMSASPKANRGLGSSRGPFSPIRPRSGLIKSFPPPTFSDEELAETKPLVHKLTQGASGVSPQAGRRASNAASAKDVQNDGLTTAQLAPRPELKLQVADPAPAPAASAEKLLITIRHPPTEKENKFKVKATHTVGRVLSSACLAFGLNAEGASLILLASDDSHVIYPCQNDSQMGSVAADGAVFNIEVPM